MKILVCLHTVPGYVHVARFINLNFSRQNCSKFFTILPILVKVLKKLACCALNFNIQGDNMRTYG